MNIYEILDYRQLLEGVLADRREQGWKLNYRKLADSARIQRSYLSKVLAGDAQLSADQAYLMCKVLNLDASQTEYFLLLIEYERTALSERKETLLARINLIRKTKQESQEYLSAESLAVDQKTQMLFYSDPLNLLVLVALNISKFAKNPENLAVILGVSKVSILESVKLLSDLKLIQKKEGGYEVQQPRTHLPRESPFYRSWSQQLALLSRQKIAYSREPRPYSFSAVFSADEGVREKIHMRFLEYLKEVEALTKGAENLELYQLNFDLFSWS